ncbi:MAG: hypothetical protein E6R05_03740 [Candidatus Moraniibacteriota bacterium]|nr:MAG: hypothetical protein E6R05_03740 [Candidatus Moranbacteria bacterium]
MKHSFETGMSPKTLKAIQEDEAMKAEWDHPKSEPSESGKKRRAVLQGYMDQLLPKITGQVEDKQVETSLRRYFPGIFETQYTSDGQYTRKALQLLDEIAQGFPGGDLADFDRYLDRKNNSLSEPYNPTGREMRI